MVQGNWSVVSLNTGPLISLLLSLSSANKPFHFLSGKSVLHNITHTELEWESGKTPRREAKGVKFRKRSRQNDLIPTIFPFHVDVAGFQCRGLAVCFGQRCN